MEYDLIKVNATPANITYDKTIIESDVELALHSYNERLETAVEVDDFKSIRADLNKDIKNVDRARIDIKKELSAPITELENFIKEQLKKFDTIIQTCNTKETEQKKLYETEKELAIKELNGYDRFAEYFQPNPKWLNKTTTLKSIQEDINSKVDKLDRDTQLIEAACAHNNINAENYVKLLKHKEVNDIIEEVLRAAQPKETTAQEPIVTKIATETAQTFTLKLTATKSQRDLLKTYMAQIGIKYEVL